MQEDHKTILEDIWGELVRGKVDRKHAFRYVILTTVGTDNWPNARTVVLRDVNMQKSCLIIFTDKRSPKVEEIQANNKVSLLFYNDKRKMQLRISATATLNSENLVAKKYFELIKQTDLKDYRTKAAPGKILQKNQPEYLDKEMALNHFTVVQLSISRIDFLQLSKDGHQRILFTKSNDEWQSTNLVP